MLVERLSVYCPLIMRKYSQHMFEVCIMLFCVFHVWSVFSFSAPSSLMKTVPLVQKVRDMTSYYVDPYLRLTSQWQSWNLFAPNPLRRVVNFSIIRTDGPTPLLVEDISPESLEWYRASVELKTVRRLEKKSKDQIALREAYLQDACRRYQLDTSATLQLMISRHIVPHHTETKSFWWWRDWQPRWSQYADVSVQCRSRQTSLHFFYQQV